jgi:nicotinate-nucleotide--dimethylbenzimidazole phosphoribosyltransferase
MNSWLMWPVKKIDIEMITLAKAYQKTLTKPIGSLGQLEVIAEQFSGWQASLHPELLSIAITVFAGDHGICRQGVSAFPQEVTAQMIINFLTGGAAISVLSRDLDADFCVVNMGTAYPIANEFTQHHLLVNEPVNSGTKDFSVEPAMTSQQLDKALLIGKKRVESLNVDLFIGGEMGIGNTTSASAIYSALLELPAENTVGPGTGIDEDGLALKQALITKALNLHQSNLGSAYDVLRCLGGFEIAGLVGSFIACAQRGIPVLVDGFICTAAALIAVRLNPDVRGWLLFSHCSAEPAHIIALDYLEAAPLLNLGLCLGEGSGAAVAVPLLKAALSLHNKMATFSQVGIEC